MLAMIVGVAEIWMSVGDSWEGYGWLGIPYRFPVIPLTVAVALCVLPQSAVLARVLDNRLSHYIATVSFGVYIWQDIVLMLMKKLFPWSFGTGSDDVLGGWFTSSLVATFIIFAIGALSYILLERPVMRWSRAREKAKRQTAPA
jgi:peptidoglycan/LPS O-acetylase OafA/YrhL